MYTVAMIAGVDDYKSVQFNYPFGDGEWVTMPNGVGFQPVPHSTHEKEAEAELAADALVKELRGRTDHVVIAVQIFFQGRDMQKGIMIKNILLSATD